jgi:hypothetical protein
MLEMIANILVMTALLALGAVSVCVCVRHDWLGSVHFAERRR